MSLRGDVPGTISRARPRYMLNGRCFILSLALASFFCFTVFLTYHSPYTFAVWKTAASIIRHPRPNVHFYRIDGLLEVTSEAMQPHPVAELIQNAQHEWKLKLARQSTSLQEAVAEYKKRYEHSPPRGFDKWWDYVQNHQVTLPDEYDAIHRSLQPYWGVQPSSLRDSISHIIRNRSDLAAFGPINTLTGRIIDVQRSNWSLSWQDQFMSQAKEHTDLLNDEDVGLFIRGEGADGNWTAIWSPWDEPQLRTELSWRSKAIKAAELGTYVDFDELPPPATGWLAGCPDDSLASALRTKNYGELLSSLKQPRPTKTFIYSPSLARSPCLHPTHLLLHHQYIDYPGTNDFVNMPKDLLWPVFGQSSTALDDDVIMGCPLYFVPNELAGAVEWEQKTDGRVVWRGHPTVEMFDGHGEDEHITVLHPISGQEVAVPRAIMDTGFDVAFVGDEEEQILLDGFADRWASLMTNEEAGLYKYTVDVDGNGWSGRFNKLLKSRSVVFKSTMYEEWFEGRIQPWVHYVPIQNDLSDLYDVYTFFRGLPSMDNVSGNDSEPAIRWDGGHDDYARRIAEASYDWSVASWRREDLVAYNFRLFLEYVRVISDDREAMSYRG